MDDLSIAKELGPFFADYAEAFSSRSPARVIRFYRARSILTFHQLSGQGTGTLGDVRAYTGGILGALLRRALPASLMLRVLFRRLAKRGYARSTIRLLGARSDGDEVRAWIAFDRFDASGATLESSHGVYRMERAASGWCIAEAWLFETPEGAPPSLALASFTPVG